MAKKKIKKSDETINIKPTLLTRFLLRAAPRWGIMRLAGELQFPASRLAMKAHRVFAKISRVDVVPLRDGWRGFQIILDHSLSLYFFQDDDHFIYDGFEIGAYGNGEVTVFDKT